MRWFTTKGINGGGGDRPAHYGHPGAPGRAATGAPGQAATGAGARAVARAAACVFATACLAGDADLTPNWATTYRAPGAAVHELVALAVDSAGNVCAAGTARPGAPDSDLLVLKFNAGGVLQWAQTYDGGVNGSDAGRDVAVNGAGESFVVGSASTAPDNIDIVGLKLDSAGQVVDTLIHNSGGAQRDDGVGIALSSTGVPYLTGIVDRTGVNGTLLRQWAPGGWQHIVTDSNPRPPIIDASDQIHIVAEWEFGSTNFAIRLAKFTAAGTMTWERIFDFEDTDRAAAVAVDSSGEVFGVSNTLAGSDPTTFGVGVVKYGPASQYRWFNILHPGGPTAPKEIRAAATDAAGNLYLAGNVENDFLVMKVWSFGALDWERREFAGAANDVVVTPDGRIIAAGRSGNTALVVGYDSTGARLFDSVYTGTGNEAGIAALALAADSSPIAVGTRRAGPTNLDALAIRYQICAAPCETTAGDTNCDGQVTVADIGPFVLALTQPAQYGAAFPACQVLNADLGGDDAITVGDIGPFVAILTGG